MGPTPAQEVAARVAAQTGNPPSAAGRAETRAAAGTPARRPQARTRAARGGLASGCNANYTPCVPNDSDVDCQGGSGNGPSYVRGPVQVSARTSTASTADDDGVGCE
jgi:hypothetical protein